MENYFNFLKKFLILFNNGNILEISDRYIDRGRGNVSFTELPEIINTPSNQHFAGWDKFRLSIRLRKMRVKMNKTEKETEMQVV